MIWPPPFAGAGDPCLYSWAPDGRTTLVDDQRCRQVTWREVPGSRPGMIVMGYERESPGSDGDRKVNVSSSQEDDVGWGSCQGKRTSTDSDTVTGCSGSVGLGLASIKS